MDSILVINKLEEMILKNTHLSIGECLYSIFRTKNSKIVNMSSLKEIRDMTNNKIYTAIENAIKDEIKE